MSVGQAKWDRDFLDLARWIAERRSKDPSTQTGAVIVDDQHRVVSVGYNGFAKGVKDLPERYADRATKLAIILHCEENAIVFADRERLVGATLYTWPFASCSKCAGLVIQSGIKRCVAPVLPNELEARWGDSLKLTRTQFLEADVELCEVDLS